MWSNWSAGNNAISLDYITKGRHRRVLYCILKGSIFHPYRVNLLSRITVEISHLRILKLFATENWPVSPDS